MQTLAQRLREVAEGSPVRLVFPEAGDTAVLQAAVELAATGCISPILPAEPEEVQAVAAGRSLDLAGLEIDASRGEVDPLTAAGSLLQEGRAEGAVLGARVPWARVQPELLPMVPRREGHPPLSGGCLLQVPGSDLGFQGAMVLTDCWIDALPQPEGLAHSAVQAGRAAASLLGAPARVALLSFSTLGSGKHQMVDRVTRATEIARSLDPDLALEGEFQADAALVPEVGKMKAPQAAVAGRANTLVFPDLQAADISIRLLTSLAGAVVVGPWVQGLAQAVVLAPPGAGKNQVLLSALVAAILARA